MRAFAQKPEPFQPARPAPSTMSARVHPEHEILGLQGTIGNRAVGRRLHLDARGGEMQEERSAALAHGLDPDAQGSKAADPFEETLRRTVYEPQPQGPESTVPGDLTQQARAIPRVDPADLWPLPRIQERLLAIAAETEARERAAAKPGAEVPHSVANLMPYWQQPFIDSVDYILHRRDGDRRAKLLKEMRAEEERLVASLPAIRPGSSASPDSAEQLFREKQRNAELVARVEALRQSYGQRWRQTVDHTADRFVILAHNQMLFATVKQKAAPVRIYGLPESAEPGLVTQAERPDILVKDSTPVAKSVIDFMEGVQATPEFKKVKAGNYKDHEKHSPYIGDADSVGKYSFDIHLPVKINEEGFYDRAQVIAFFDAVNKAAKDKGISWIALYNDFEVAKTVNEKLGQIRVGFSGARDAGPGQEGSIHHGPAPYLLHIHFNIMPNALAGQLKAANPLLPQIDLSYMQ